MKRSTKGLWKRLRRALNSFFTPVMLSFALVCSTMLLGTGISYFRNARLIEENIENYNMQLVAHIKESVDGVLSTALRKIYDYSYEKRILDFTAQRDFYEPQALLSALNIINMNSSVCSTYGYYSDIFVYFDKTDVLLNRETYFSAEDYRARKITDFDITAEQWQQMLHTYSYFDVMVAQGGRDILVRTSINTADRRDVAAMVGLRIRGSEIQGRLDAADNIDRMHAYVLDSQNRIIASTSDTQMDSLPFAPQVASGSDGYFYDVIGKERVLVSYMTSDYNGWRYVVTVPVHLVMQDVSVSRNLSISMLGVFILLIVLLGVYMHRKIYYPVRDLLLRIRSASYTADVSGNEVQAVTGMLESIVQEREDILRSMEEQYPVIKNTRLSALLSENEDPQSILEELQAMQIDFPHDTFAVLSVDIERAGGYAADKFGQERVLVKSVIANIAREVFEPVGAVFSVELAWDKIALILSCALPEPSGETVLDCAQELLATLRVQFGILVTIGVSREGSGVSTLPGLYREAEEARSHKLVKGINMVTRFEPAEFSAGEYFYPTYIENKLINCVSVGNRDQSLELLDTILDKNFRQGNPPLPYARCLFFDIISTVLKLLAEMKVDTRVVFGADANIEKELIDCETVDDMAQTIRRIIIEICGYVNSDNRSRSQELLDAILLHIRQNYTDKGICIASIAEAAGITQNYLSHYFKEKTGQPVMKYIKEMRVEHTKRLLRETDMTLSEIADAVGISESAILIRMFKSSEGITPGQYRDREKG